MRPCCTHFAEPGSPQIVDPAETGAGACDLNAALWMPETPAASGAIPSRCEWWPKAFDVVARAMAGHRFHITSESALQIGIGTVLSGAGLTAVAEYVVGKDRFDFFLPDPGLAIEVKIDGSLTEITRQLYRYAAHDEVEALMLLTTRRQHDRLPSSMHGKPVRVEVVRAGAFG